MSNKDFKKELIRRCYKFSLEVIHFIDILPNRDFSAEIIARQLLRSATSIGANIIEGQASSSRKDFINFMHHALKSSNETKYWLGLLRDSGKIDKNKVEKLLKEAIELSNILGSCLLSLKGKK